MKNLIFTFLLTTVCFPIWAATVTITDGSDLYTSVGDYAAVGGFTGDLTAQGQVFDVLNTSEASVVNNSFDIGDLYDLLDGVGISSTSALVFGFSANEQGNNQTVSITQLDMSFERSGQANTTFSLNADNVEVIDFNGGNSLAEAQFQVNLGFDFMAEYSSNSTDQFLLTASFIGNTNGSDRIFLSTGLTQNLLVSAVPIPGAVWLFGSGLIGLIGIAKRKKA